MPALSKLEKRNKFIAQAISLMNSLISNDNQGAHHVNLSTEINKFLIIYNLLQSDGLKLSIHQANKQTGEEKAQQAAKMVKLKTFHDDIDHITLAERIAAVHQFRRDAAEAAAQAVVVEAEALPLPENEEPEFPPLDLTHAYDFGQVFDLNEALEPVRPSSQSVNDARPVVYGKLLEEDESDEKEEMLYNPQAFTVSDTVAKYTPSNLLQIDNKPFNISVPVTPEEAQRKAIEARILETIKNSSTLPLPIINATLLQQVLPTPPLNVTDSLEDALLQPLNPNNYQQSPLDLILNPGAPRYQVPIVPTAQVTPASTASETSPIMPSLQDRIESATQRMKHIIRDENQENLEGEISLLKGDVKKLNEEIKRSKRVIAYNLPPFKKLLVAEKGMEELNSFIKALDEVPNADLLSSSTLLSNTSPLAVESNTAVIQAPGKPNIDSQTNKTLNSDFTEAKILSSQIAGTGYNNTPSNRRAAVQLTAKLESMKTVLESFKVESSLKNAINKFTPKAEGTLSKFGSRAKARRAVTPRRAIAPAVVEVPVITPAAVTEPVASPARPSKINDHRVTVEDADSDDEFEPQQLSEDAVEMILLPTQVTTHPNRRRQPVQDSINEDSHGVMHRESNGRFIYQSPKPFNLLIEAASQPENKGPVFLALNKELGRLRAKASNPSSILGFFNNASAYQAKADKIDMLLSYYSDIDDSEQTIVSDMANEDSLLYKALNTHTSKLFTFTSDNYGVTRSLETRAVKHMQEAIEATEQPISSLSSLSSAG